MILQALKYEDEDDDWAEKGFAVFVVGRVMNCLQSWMNKM